MSDFSKKTDAYWQDKLTEDEYRICRLKGTERPFTGEYWDNKLPGNYVCKCCGEYLFSSATKFDSGSGWPSFYQAVDLSSISEDVDTTLGMVRTEISCARCGCHLGHLFPDGPEPTGLRYCINSASLCFQPGA